MNTLQKDLQLLFERDLNTLIENIRSIPDEVLWDAPDGVTNSCGVLAQHLVGNLNHFIGHGIGETGYVRNREKEFTNTGLSKEKLINDIQELKATLVDVFENLEKEDLHEDYPLDTSYDATIQQFLLHLYGHLNYHLGQINYLRRILFAKMDEKNTTE
jgi:uncharacterized damage-inducible protein DinB